MPVQPHGGQLVDRVLGKERVKEIGATVESMFQLSVSPGTISEIQNIARGVFSPLEGFLGREQLAAVVSDGHLPDGLAWTIPILLAIEEDQAKQLKEGHTLALVDSKGKPLAIMHLEEKYRFDKSEIARGVFGTDDENHPGVRGLFHLPDLFLAGPIDLLEDIRKPYER